MKFRVYGTVSVPVFIEVEAENEDSAREAADESWSGVSSYCGNGRRHGALIGTSDRHISFEGTDEPPEWRTVEIKE